MRGLLLLIFISMGGFCLAQNPMSSVIQWNAVKTMEVVNGKFEEEITTLVTYHGDSILWRNEDNTIRYSFEVVRQSQEWINVSTPGVVHYNVTSGPLAGVITIERNSLGIRASLVLVAEGHDENFELTIARAEEL